MAQIEMGKVNATLVSKRDTKTISLLEKKTLFKKSSTEIIAIIREAINTAGICLSFPNAEL